jgi:hypothetical protein
MNVHMGVGGRAAAVAPVREMLDHAPSAVLSQASPTVDGATAATWL